MRLIPDTGSNLPPFEVKEGTADAETYVGRGDRNDVVIDDDRISSQHLRIFREEKRWNVENISSVNRAFVAKDDMEEELVPGFPHQLKQHQVISLLIPKTRRMINDVWLAYKIELSPLEQKCSEVEPDTDFLDGASMSMAVSEQMDTKEWRSPFDTNPTFDSGDLAKIERALIPENDMIDSLLEAPHKKLSPVVEVPAATEDEALGSSAGYSLSRNRNLMASKSREKNKWDEIDDLCDEMPPEDCIGAMNRLADKWLPDQSSSTSRLPETVVLTPSSASRGTHGLGGYNSRSPSSAASSPTKAQQPDTTILWPPPDM